MPVGSPEGSAPTISSDARIGAPVPDGLKTPFHDQNIDPRVVQHGDANVTEFLPRPETYTREEEINRLIQIVRNGEWEEQQVGQRKFEAGFRGRAAHMLEGEMGLVLSPPDPATNRHTVEYSRSREFLTRGKRVLKKGVISAGIMGAATILTGGTIALPAVLAVAGSVAGRSAVEAYRMISGKERTMRTRILLARERMYQKAKELADRTEASSNQPHLGVTHPTLEQIKEIQAFHDRRNQAIIDLVNFTHATEHNCVRFAFDSNGDPYIRTERFGASHRPGSELGEPQMGGPAGPSRNRGTEVSQNWQYGPGVTLNEMEKELEAYRHKMDKIASIFAIGGGLLAGVGTGVHEVLQAKGEMAQQSAEGIWADIDGNGYDHLIHTVDAHAQSVAFDYASIEESFDAFMNGANVNFNVGEFGGHGLGADAAKALELIREAVSQGASATHLRHLYTFLPAGLVGLVGQYVAEHVGENRKHESWESKRGQFITDQEKERRALQPEGSAILMERLRNQALRENKIFPEAGQDWFRLIEHPDGVQQKQWIHVEQLLSGPEGEGMAKVMIIGDEESDRDTPDIKDIVDIYRNYIPAVRRSTDKYNTRVNVVPRDDSGGGGGGPGSYMHIGRGPSGGGGESDAGDAGAPTPVPGEGGTVPAPGVAPTPEPAPAPVEDGGSAPGTSPDDKTEPKIGTEELKKKIAAAQELAAKEPKPEHSFDIIILKKENDKFWPVSFKWPGTEVTARINDFNKILSENFLDREKHKNHPLIQYNKARAEGNKNARLKLRVTKAKVPDLSKNESFEPFVYCDAIGVEGIDKTPEPTPEPTSGSKIDDRISSEKKVPSEKRLVIEHEGEILEGTLMAMSLDNIHTNAPATPLRYLIKKSMSVNGIDVTIPNINSSESQEIISKYWNNRYTAIHIEVENVKRNAGGGVEKYQCKIVDSAVMAAAPVENKELPARLEEVIQKKEIVLRDDINFTGDGESRDTAYSYDQNVMYSNDIPVPIRLLNFESNKPDFLAKKPDKGFNNSERVHSTMNRIGKYMTALSEGKKAHLKLKPIFSGQEDGKPILWMSVEGVYLTDAVHNENRAENIEPHDFTFSGRKPMNKNEIYDLKFPGKVALREVSYKNAQGKFGKKYVLDPISIEGMRGGGVGTSDEKVQDYIKNILSHQSEVRIRTNPVEKHSKYYGKFDFLYNIVIPADEHFEIIDEGDPSVEKLIDRLVDIKGDEGKRASRKKPKTGTVLSGEGDEMSGRKKRVEEEHDNNGDYNGESSDSMNEKTGDGLASVHIPEIPRRPHEAESSSNDHDKIKERAIKIDKERKEMQYTLPLALNSEPSDKHPFIIQGHWPPLVTTTGVEADYPYVPIWMTRYDKLSPDEKVMVYNYYLNHGKVGGLSLEFRADQYQHDNGHDNGHNNRFDTFYVVVRPIQLVGMPKDAQLEPVPESITSLWGRADSSEPAQGDEPQIASEPIPATSSIETSSSIERGNPEIKKIRNTIEKYRNMGRAWLEGFDAPNTENSRFSLEGIHDLEHQQLVRNRWIVGGMLRKMVADKTKTTIDDNSPILQTIVFRISDINPDWLKNIANKKNNETTVTKNNADLNRRAKEIVDEIVRDNTIATPPEPQVSSEPVEVPSPEIAPTPEATPAVESPAIPATGELETSSETSTVSEPEGKEIADKLVADIWKQLPLLGDISELNEEDKFLTCVYNRKHQGELMPVYGSREDMERQVKIALDADGQSGEARADAISKIEELQEEAFQHSKKMWEQVANSASVIGDDTPEAGVVQPATESSIATETNEAPAAVEAAPTRFNTRSLIKGSDELKGAI